MNFGLFSNNNKLIMN